MGKTSGLLAVMALLLLGDCVNTGYRQVIEVKRGNSVDEKLQLAKEFATEERLATLKAEIHRILPGTTAQQLSRMALLWNDVRATQADGSVHRRVTITLVLEERAGVNGADVMRVASELIDRDLNGTSAGG